MAAIRRMLGKGRRKSLKNLISILLKVERGFCVSVSILFMNLCCYVLMLFYFLPDRVELLNCAKVLCDLNCISKILC